MMKQDDEGDMRAGDTSLIDWDVVSAEALGRFPVDEVGAALALRARRRHATLTMVALAAFALASLALTMAGVYLKDATMNATMLLIGPFMFLTLPGMGAGLTALVIASRARASRAAYAAALEAAEARGQERWPRERVARRLERLRADISAQRDTIEDSVASTRAIARVLGVGLALAVVITAAGMAAAASGLLGARQVGVVMLVQCAVVIPLVFVALSRHADLLRAIEAAWAGRATLGEMEVVARAVEDELLEGGLSVATSTDTHGRISVAGAGDGDLEDLGASD
jgi:hypothetical protein